jgi:hypothetical protein
MSLTAETKTSMTAVSMVESWGGAWRGSGELECAVGMGWIL